MAYRILLVSIKTDDVYFYECDVSNRQAVFDVAAKVKEEVSSALDAGLSRTHVIHEVGEPTVLINNAGIVHPGSILNCSEHHIRKYVPQLYICCVQIELTP